MTRPLRLALAATASIAASITVSAGAHAFDVEILGPVSGPISDVEVSVAEDIIKPQRFGRRSNRDRDTIGPRDAENVIAVVDKAITRELESKGVLNAAADGSVLRVTVTKVRATNLQFTEYGVRNNLGFGSIGAGGAAFEAELVAPDGAITATFEYDRFETFLDRHIATASSTWSDARRAGYLFGSKIAKAVQDDATS